MLAAPNSGDQLARVKAILRVRPVLPFESQKENVIQLDGATCTIPSPRIAGQALNYAFDGCYGATSTQNQIFTENLEPLLDHVIAGYNSTVFAYGNTGAGKTFTMQGTPDDPGMIELAVTRLLERLHERIATGQVRWQLGMSYLEIYKERVYDLLASNAAATDLALREDSMRNILVPGLTSLPLKCLDDFRLGYENGTRNRSMASTKLNSQSSRSHACLMLTLEQQPALGPALRSKLHLIDLAGSEDNRRTANTGERLVESGAINSSLFVLGQVVDALNKNAPRIPYRDSKLTRLLQDSLGGRAYALVITNVAPTVNWLQETAASLNFAAKSRNITNKVVINTVEEPKKSPKKTSKSKKSVEDYEYDEEDFEDGYEYEEEESVYELSEPPSSVSRSHCQVLPTPPVTGGTVRKSAQSNPFLDDANPIESVIERQVEAKVAAKLRELSRGTILSPLLKARQGELDLKQLKKTIKRGSSALRGTGEAPPKKSKKQQTEDMKALEEMTGIVNMFPSVEPDLLHILNNASEAQLRKLKEFGQSRAEDVVHGRASNPYAALSDLESRGVLTAKVLLKVVYANAMDADSLAALAHNVQSSTDNASTQ